LLRLAITEFCEVVDVLAALISPALHALNRARVHNRDQSTNMRQSTGKNRKAGSMHRQHSLTQDPKYYSTLHTIKPPYLYSDGKF
jgi:hypothetical protein